MSRIAFIGLGMMGRPMAERLIAEGFDVRLSDSDASLAAEFGQAWTASAAEAAEGADFVITMLPNGHIVREVLLGEGGVAAVLAPGAILIDTSSSDAGGTVDLGAELADRSIRVVDAPVSGGVALARDGKLSLMVGCADDALYAAVEPLLSALGSRIVRVGGLGAGHASKAINNAVAACIFAATSEGLVLGERFGIAPELLLDVLNSSTGRSGVSEGPFRSQVLTRTFALGFSLPLMTKDVGLAETLRSRLGLELPLLAETYARWSQALDALGPSSDFTRFHQFVEDRAGD